MTALHVACRAVILSILLILLILSKQFVLS
jgi:hypothetical protein